MHFLLKLGAGLLLAIEGHRASDIQCDNGNCYNKQNESDSIFHMVFWTVGAVFILVTVTLLCATKSKKTPKSSPRHDSGQKSTSEDKSNLYGELEKVVLNNLELVNLVGEHTQFVHNDGLSRSLVLIFESNKSMLPLLYRLVDTDIKDASVRFEQENTLLRKNSFCSKVLSYYNRTSGHQYLRRIFQSILTDIVRENVYCEIDTSKLPQGTEVEPSQKYLLEKCNLILHAILNSINDAPPTLRNLCYYLKRQIVTHLPKYSSVLNNYNNFDATSFDAISIGAIEEVEEKSESSSSSGVQKSGRKEAKQDGTKRESAASLEPESNNTNTMTQLKQSDNGEKQQEGSDSASTSSSSSEREPERRENINQTGTQRSIDDTVSTPKSPSKKKTPGRKRRKSSCFGIDDDEEDKEENNQVFYNAIGSMLFLRLYCPAISVPSETSLINERARDNAKRTLTLIAKVLQNLANGVKFGRKEPFMTVMNPFIRDNLENIKKFFDNIAAVEVDLKESAKTLEIPAETKESAMKVIFAAIVGVEDKLQKEKYYESLSRLMDSIGRDVVTTPAINIAKRKVQDFSMNQ